MPHAELEGLIDAHNKATGEHFEVVWGAGQRPTAAQAKAHAFALPTLSGGRYDFGEVLGKRPAVVAFWASWCAPCVLEAPHLQALHEELGTRIDVVGVSIDEGSGQRRLKAKVERLGLTYPVPLDQDGSVHARFNPGGAIPYTVVVDDEGEVTYLSTNFEPGDEAKLRAAVRGVVTQ